MLERQIKLLTVHNTNKFSFHISIVRINFSFCIYTEAYLQMHENRKRQWSKYLSIALLACFENMFGHFTWTNHRIYYTTLTIWINRSWTSSKSHVSYTLPSLSPSISGNRSLSFSKQILVNQGPYSGEKYGPWTVIFIRKRLSNISYLG